MNKWMLGLAWVGLSTLLALPVCFAEEGGSPSCTDTRIVGTRPIPGVTTYDNLGSDLRITLSATGRLARDQQCSVQVTCVAVGNANAAQKKIRNTQCSTIVTALSRTIPKSGKAEIVVKKLSAGSGLEAGVVYVTIK